MNIYAFAHGINAIIALILGSIFFFTRPRKPVVVAHGAFSYLLFLYTFPYFFWGIQTESNYGLFWLQALLYSCCFIHTGFLHFVLLLTDQLKKYKPLLICLYGVSVLFAILNFFQMLFLPQTTRQVGPFLYCAKGSTWLLCLITVQVTTFLLSHFLLLRSALTLPTSKKRRLISYTAISFIGWLGGLLNWFLFWDVWRIFPFGNFGVGLLLVGTYYLILREDFLEIDTTARKAFVYAIMTLIITLVYTSFILLTEKLSRDYFGYSSFFASVLAALSIALFFNPIRSFLNRQIDKILFGKNLLEMSTENLKMQLELQKQDHMKTVATLAAGMAHEIKNPLTSLKTFAQYLPTKYDDPEFRDKFSRIVMDEVDRVNNIVRQLLDFARPQDAVITAVDANEILESTLELLSNNLLKSGIELKKDLHSSALISADKNQLKQVLLNIILNAIQAMPTGGVLKASTSEEHQFILISIKDTGPGIPKDKTDKIFDPFFTTKQDGTGLGLSIVHGIIQNHGGKIEVSSQMGVGTEFRILLPKVGR